MMLHRKEIKAVVGATLVTSGILAATLSSADAVTPPAPEVVAHYAVMQRPATDRDLSAQAAVKAFGSSPSASLDADTARVVDTSTDRIVSAVAGQVNGVPTTCLHGQSVKYGAGLVCGGTLSQPTAMVGYGSSIGIVPAEVESVVFDLTDGKSIKSPVQSNVWRAPAEAARIRYEVGGKLVEFDLMPLSSFPKGATIKDGVVWVKGPPPAGLKP